jgi:hypothetical protein
METTMIDFIDAAEVSRRLGGRDLGGGQPQAHHPPPADSPGCGGRDREWWLRENERTGLGDWGEIIALHLWWVSHLFPVESDFMRACRLDDERRAPPAPRRPAPRPTPRVTIEAIWHCVRERGPKALEEPANLQRLRTFDADAIAELDRRMAKLSETAK